MPSYRGVTSRGGGTKERYGSVLMIQLSFETRCFLMQEDRVIEECFRSR